MVYMADDYFVTLNWEDDINEMEAATQAASTNVIALVDDYGPGNSKILKVANDPNFLNDTIVSPVVDDGGAVISGGEVDMASPSTLSSFVQFGAQSYPADRLVLVLWGHGASWRGLCPDGSDVLTLPELRTGLSEAVTSIGRPLDMVVVDSCAEASVEMLTQLRGLATIFVGSEKDVPFQGLPYVLVMNDLALDTDQGPVRFGMRIVEDYVTWSTTNSDYSVTMGVFNITRMDPFLVDLNTLSLAVTRYDQLFHPAMRTALESSEHYEEDYRVDFADLMWRLFSADLPLEIRHSAVQCLLGAEGIVEHFRKYSNPLPDDGVFAANATGLTIYAPSDDPIDSSYSTLQIANSSWIGCGVNMRNDTATIQSGPGPAVYLFQSEVYDSPFNQTPPIDTAKLIWPEIYDGVQAVIYRERAGGLDAVEEFKSPGTSIEFVLPGRLTIAASAEDGGQATSYVVLNFTLEGFRTVAVSLFEDGEPVEAAMSHYTVTGVTSNGTKIQSLPSPVATNGCIIPLYIPRDADIGDTLTIEVRDSDSDELAGRAETTILPDGTKVQVTLWETGTHQNQNLVLLLFVALPGLLLVAFALLMYRQNRTRREAP
jgi:hypothetical protein